MPTPVEEYFRLREELAAAEQNVAMAIRRLHSAAAMLDSGEWKSDSPPRKPRVSMARLPEWPTHRELSSLINTYRAAAAAVEDAYGKLHAKWPAVDFAEPGLDALTEPEMAHRSSRGNARI